MRPRSRRFRRRGAAGQRVEDEQRGPERGDGVREPLLVGGGIDAQGRRGDDVEVERSELDAGGGADALEAVAHDAERVLGGKQQHAAGARDGEAAQARCARRDRDRDVERQE